MTMKQRMHAEETEILRAIVDEADLRPEVREHLTTCEQCSALKARIEGDLTNLGQTAKRLAPAPRRRIVVPYETRLVLPSWLSRFSPFTIGLVTVSVVFVLLGFAFFGTTPENKTAKLYREMLEDEKLISEVTSLEDDALPPYYLDMFPDLKQQPGETSKSSIVPRFGSGISSLHGDEKKTS